MTPPTSNRHWYHLTPARFFMGLLAVQVFLLLSEWFQWFAFNEYKGWTVLIAVGVVGLAVLLMLVWGLVCLCLRRRFQFNVRSLLLFLMAVSVPLGWFAWELQRARRQREAVEAITEGGAKVFYDGQVAEEEGSVVVTTDAAKRSWLRELLGEDFFGEVVVVDCSRTTFGDVDARHLRELTNVKYLFLHDTQITDNGLEHLTGMTEIVGLTLDGTHVTDQGVKKLQHALPNWNIH